MTNAASDPWPALAFHQGDWMRKALTAKDLRAKDMAEYLDVDVATVSRWMNGKKKPGRQTLILWALKTGVPLSYLEEGVLPDDSHDGGPGGTADSKKITDWLLASGTDNVIRAAFGNPHEIAA